MKKLLALGAAVFLCTSLGPPTGGAIAYPYRIVLIINGERHVVPNPHGPIHSVRIRQFGFYFGAYTLVEIRHGDGALSYHSLDTNELHLTAQ